MFLENVFVFVVNKKKASLKLSCTTYSLEKLNSLEFQSYKPNAVLKTSFKYIREYKQAKIVTNNTSLINSFCK